MLLIFRNNPLLKSFLSYALIAVLSTLLMACGGGNDGASSTPASTPATYTLSTQISGLNGTLVLTNNNSGSNAEGLVVNANGNSAFASAQKNGAVYQVTVLTQPTN